MYPLYNAPINTKYTVMYCNYSIILKSTPSGCIQHAKPLLTPKFQSYDYITWKKMNFLYYTPIYTNYTVIECNQKIFFTGTFSGHFQQLIPPLTLKFCSQNHTIWEKKDVLCQYTSVILQYTATGTYFQRAPLLAVFSMQKHPWSKILVYFSTE